MRCSEFTGPSFTRFKIKVDLLVKAYSQAAMNSVYDQQNNTEPITTAKAKQ